MRRDAADPNQRTEITFLAETVAAVAHPAGGVVLAAGKAADGTNGIYAATEHRRERTAAGLDPRGASPDPR